MDISYNISYSDQRWWRQTNNALHLNKWYWQGIGQLGGPFQWQINLLKLPSLSKGRSKQKIKTNTLPYILTCINNAINSSSKFITTSVCICFSFTPLYLSDLILKARQAISCIWLLPLCCCLLRNEQLERGKVMACAYLPMDEMEAKRLI